MKSEKIHNLIDANCGHQHFGRLLYHRDRKNKSILHYSVQINDYQSLGWEPTHSGMKVKGKISVWKIDWKRYRPAKCVHHLPKAKITKALHRSVDKFHKKWMYELFRFNCEHWARLVTTGKCRCFQIHEIKKVKKVPVIGFLIVGLAEQATGAWECNRYAEKVIRKVW